MVAVVEALAVKGSKATEEAEGEAPPPALRRHRQPPPDHPPYCWMIGEAIDALCEDGGSAEGSISEFIRARHPGVPAAHDRFLRHYLAKHVAEGFFVRTAPGRYARSSDEPAVEEAPVKQAVSAAGPSEAVCAGSPATTAKRGRGRPRKDGSSPASPAGNKDGSAGVQSPTTPKRRGRRAAATLAAAEGPALAPSVAAADKKDGSQATSSKPRRRGRHRKVALATPTDGSGKALVTNTKDRGDAPSVADEEHGSPLELALVLFGDSSATAPFMENLRGDSTPPTTPAGSGQPRDLAPRTDTDVPAPMPPADKEDGGEAPSFDMALDAKPDGVCSTSTAPESSSQACELPVVAVDDVSVPVLIADEKDGVEVEAPPAFPPHKVEPMPIAGQSSAPAPIADKKARAKALSATPKSRRQRRKSATGNRSAPAPIAGKKASSEVSSATPKLKLGGTSAPASVADKKDSNKAPVNGGARKLYPMTAEELPEDPLFCLLALPAFMPGGSESVAPKCNA